MEPIVCLVRHAEAEHNISNNFSRRDPGLTLLGVTQASSLSTQFPDPASVAIVLTSPLKRTLQTTLAGFSEILTSGDTKKSDKGDNSTGAGAKLIIDRDLQERSDLPCDTGSDRATLEKAFPELDFSSLSDNWFTKSGLHAPDETSVALRAKVVRGKLWSIAESLRKETAPGEQRLIVIITHGVFMKYLSQDMSIDLPKAGWQNFKVLKGTDGEVILARV